jgi:hypothetical protein
MKPLEDLEKDGDNMKMNLKEVEWDGVNWTDLFEDRKVWRFVLNTLMKMWVS